MSLVGNLITKERGIVSGNNLNYKTALIKSINNSEKKLNETRVKDYIGYVWKIINGKIVGFKQLRENFRNKKYNRSQNENRSGYGYGRTRGGFKRNPSSNRTNQQ